MHILKFIHSATDGYLGDFQFEALSNRVTLNTLVHESWFTCVCLSVGS